MRLSEKIKELDFKGRDFPIIAGTVKFKLHNVHNGKDEVVEEHNMATNALKDIFTNNYGGLINYQNFASLYNTWLGGVLLFQNQLDLTSADDYGIPAYTSNPVKAHAGQTPLTDQADDLTRGNPDSTGTVLAVNSTKLRWEWGTSAGNGTIASLGLTHTDVGSYGCGVVSNAQRSLVPFVSVGAIDKSYSYGDNGNVPMAINNNKAYSFYMVDTTTVDVFITPINDTKFKLQGSSLTPITAYSTKITATLPTAYPNNKVVMYYWFDFANDVLVLFCVPTLGGSTLYKDEISLADGTVTHTDITLSGVRLWQFGTAYNDYGSLEYPVAPTPAMICNNRLYVYAISGTGSGNYQRYADKMYSVNLANTADIVEVDTTDYSDFSTKANGGNGFIRCCRPFSVIGDMIIHRNFIVNGYKTFAIEQGLINYTRYFQLHAYNHNVCSPLVGIGDDANAISACKLYLATKFNLPNAVTKTSAQSMTVEYQLSEV